MTATSTLARTARPITPAERRMHHVLGETDPELGEGFLRHLSRARGVTCRRLLAALWREDVAGLRSTSTRLGDWVTHGLGPGEALTFPIRQERAFTRIETGQPVLHLRPGSVGGWTLIESPASLADLLKYWEPAPGWDALADELDDSVAKLALAYARVATRQSRRPRRNEELLLFYERRNTEGHNLHPCARTRIGMTAHDVLRYDLEADDPTELVLVGVRRDRVESTPDEWGRDVGQVLRAAYPRLDDAVRQRVRDPENYVFLPVHPWQLDKTVRSMFTDDIADGAVVVVPKAKLCAAPTASLRTLLAEPSATGERLFVKTAVDVQITSTRRTISAHTTNNGPRYSRLLRRIIAAEPELADRVVAMSELAGASYLSSDDRRTRALSALVREGVRLRPGETAIPACALTAPSPDASGNVLTDLLRVQGGRSAPLDWLSEYAALLLPTVVTLMTKYGVGLEAHLQNCVPTFERGRPHRLLLRDWGGIRIYPPRLERHGLRVARRPGSLTVTDDVDVMRARALSTVLPNHLAEIVGHLVGGCGVRERDAWRRIGQVLDRVLARLQEQPAIQSDVHGDRAVLFGAQVPVKAMVRMRLWPDRGDEYVHAPSPLRNYWADGYADGYWVEPKAEA